jgi:hypothetical protein
MKMMSPPKMRHFLLSTTLLIVILVMDTGRNANGQEDQPECQCQTDVNNTYGLGGHRLTTTDGFTIGVTLTKKSRKATPADLENYVNSERGEFKGCKVTKKDKFL